MTSRTQDYENRDGGQHYNRKRKYELKKLYGITPLEYDDLLEAQDFRCAICSTDEPGHKGLFMVDHNHDTDEIRGLLCNKCNSGLGMFDDSVARLSLAIEYLRKHGSYGAQA